MTDIYIAIFSPNLHSPKTPISKIRSIGIAPPFRHSFHSPIRAIAARTATTRLNSAQQQHSASQFNSRRLAVRACVCFFWSVRRTSAFACVFISLFPEAHTRRSVPFRFRGAVPFVAFVATRMFLLPTEYHNRLRVFPHVCMCVNPCVHWAPTSSMCASHNTMRAPTSAVDRRRRECSHCNNVPPQRMSY